MEVDNEQEEEIQFRYRGLHSSDTFSQRELRAEINRITRENRIRHRTGEPELPVPTMPGPRINTEQVIMPIPQASIPAADRNMSLPSTITYSPINDVQDHTATWFGQKDPSYDSRSTESLESPAVSEVDWSYITEFRKVMFTKEKEYCVVCKEKWFDLNVRGGMCLRCTQESKKFTPHEPAIFSYGVANMMDPGEVPAYLPQLSPIEEMLIAKVHVAMQVYQVRGQQYKYRGHIVNFLRETGRTFNQIPVLPEHLDILVLRPSRTNQDERLERQFRQDCRIRRKAIQDWIIYLKANHSGYADTAVNEDALSSLPLDGSVWDRLMVSEQDESVTEDNIRQSDNEDYLPPDTSAVPDLLPRDSEIQQLRQAIRAETGNSMQFSLPLIHATPINEFNQTEKLLSLAFPTLYPTGQGDYVCPRIKKIDYGDYLKHLMKYHDGRFAKHNSWRYVVFNTWMRMKAFKCSRVTASRRDVTDLNFETLCQALAENDTEGQRLLSLIRRSSSKLRGTREYWVSNRNNLLAYVRNLKSPHLFLTLSAADHHWQDLLRHMPRYNEWKDGTSAIRMQIARQNLRDHPHIAAYWFYTRFNTFRKIVLDKKFRISDWWVRYEWQSRGSTHCHGIYWIDGAPDPEVERLSAHERQVFANEWGLVLSAEDPSAKIQTGSQQRIIQESARTVLSSGSHELRNTFATLSSIVNRVQVHDCGTAYCQRKDRETGEIYCRFRFPFPETEIPYLAKPPRCSYYRFYPIRNRADLNPYNRTISLSWLANIDLAPTTGKQAVVNYVAKYVSKNEVQSITYQEMVQNAMRNVRTRNPLLTTIRKVMNMLIAERDWSAQEVSHHLLGLDLVHGSRQVVYVDCRPEHEQTLSYVFGENDDDNHCGGKSSLQKYKDRPESLNDLTYFDFLRNYNVKGTEYRKRTKGKPRVLNYIPRYDHEEQPEDYARVKMMLHHPFRYVDSLLNLEEQFATNYAEIFEFCKSAHSHSNDYYDEDDPEEEEPSQALENDDDGVLPQETWMEIRNQRPGNELGETADAFGLGDRPIDRSVQWENHIGSYADWDTKRWNTLKISNPVSLNVNAGNIVTSLASKQKDLYDLITKHYDLYLQGRNPAPLHLNLDGRAGTGKSYAILLISEALQDMSKNHGIEVDSPIIRTAPTGVAAFGIKGRTLHSLFRLPIGGTRLAPLESETLGAIQSRFKDVKYLFIDEKSMIHLKILSWIDQRCRQIFPASCDLIFGGLSIILCGDFRQLPPVGGRPLYFSDFEKLKNPDELIGFHLYGKFRTTLELNVLQRQQGDDENALLFRSLLEHFRNRMVDIKDFTSLSQRIIFQLSRTER